MKLCIGLYSEKAHKIVEDAVKLAILELRALRFCVPLKNVEEHISAPFDAVYSVQAHNAFAGWYEKQANKAAQAASVYVCANANIYSGIPLAAMTTDIEVDSSNDIRLTLDSVLDGQNENMMQDLARAVSRLATHCGTRGYTKADCLTIADVLYLGVSEAAKHYPKATMEELVGRPLNIMASNAVQVIEGEIRRLRKDWEAAADESTQAFADARNRLQAEYDEKFAAIDKLYGGKIDELMDRLHKLRGMKAPLPLSQKN